MISLRGGTNLSLSAGHHRYGPLAIEVKEKKARTQRAKNQWEAEQVRPEEVSFSFWGVAVCSVCVITDGRVLLLRAWWDDNDSNSSELRMSPRMRTRRAR